MFDQVVEQRGFSAAIVEVEHQRDLHAPLHRFEKKLLHVTGGEIVDTDEN